MSEDNVAPKVMIERIQKFLKEGKRFDGRKPEEFREIVIESPVSKKAEGSVRVKLGKSEVIVGVKLGVTAPYPDSPNKGNLMVSAELLPLSSNRIELGRPGIDSIELGRVTDRALRESGFIDFEKLCITEGEKVWQIFVDIYSINDDGNMLDAANIGSILALSMAEIPKYDEEADKVLYGESSGNKIPLTENVPLSITVHKIGDEFIVDPTRLEEDASTTRVTIGSFKGSISSMQKGEEDSLTVEEFEKVLDLNEKVNETLAKTLEKHLK